MNVLITIRNRALKRCFRNAITHELPGDYLASIILTALTTQDRLIATLKIVTRIDSTAIEVVAIASIITAETVLYRCKVTARRRITSIRCTRVLIITIPLDKETLWRRSVHIAIPQ